MAMCAHMTLEAEGRDWMVVRKGLYLLTQVVFKDSNQVGIMSTLLDGVSGVSFSLIPQ